MPYAHLLALSLLWPLASTACHDPAGPASSAPSTLPAASLPASALPTPAPAALPSPLDHDALARLRILRMPTLQPSQSQETLAPGVYQTYPYSILIISPSPHADDGMAIIPQDNSSRIMIIRPELHFGPRVSLPTALPPLPTLPSQEAAPSQKD
ncbi:MAG: hypothetical protein IT443_06480 [Phycisphaeraceae bacterium]|nr:hypothetical protein [Phycisphaeraceae bacterium]